MKKFIIAIFIIVLPLSGTILLRNTFERYEQEDGDLCGWSSTTGGSGIVELGPEDSLNE